MRAAEYGGRRGWTHGRWRFFGIVGVLGLGTVCFLGLETWWNRIEPAGITVHHTGLPFDCDVPSSVRVDAALIDRFHKDRGYGVRYLGRKYYISYHYLILPDGTVQQGRPERCIGAHTRSHNDTLGISLVGNFDGEKCRSDAAQPRWPTPLQMTSLVQLTRRLLEKYGLPASSIKVHSDFGVDTQCPGSAFPKLELLQRVARGE